VQTVRRFVAAKGTCGYWLYLLVRYSIRLFLYPYFRVRIIGRENLNIDGPVIVAPTHRSNLDAPLLGAAPNWRPRSLSKESLFVNPFMRYIIVSLGSFPVKRGAADREALRTAQSLLEENEHLLIFPEGTRQSGDEIGEIFDGTAYMAARSGSKVLPIGIFGTESAMPPGVKFPRRSKVTIVVGEALYPPASSGRVKREQLTEFTIELRARLQKAYDEAYDASNAR
jgi:1-acyl-sn-glycerol-3-phosphate acyltransferase